MSARGFKIFYVGTLLGFRRYRMCSKQILRVYASKDRVAKTLDVPLRHISPPCATVEPSTKTRRCDGLLLFSGSLSGTVLRTIFVVIGYLLRSEQSVNQLCDFSMTQPVVVGTLHEPPESIFIPWEEDTVAGARPVLHMSQCNKIPSV